VRLHEGDVGSFQFPSGSFSHVVHAATETSGKKQQQDPLLLIETIIGGTKRTLEFARHSGVKKFLITSSGAVYGSQPPDVHNISEDYPGSPDPTSPTSAYGQSKRTAELMCSVYADKYGLNTSIARCFAFVGPYMPLDEHFAIGNFIRDGMRGGPIFVNGDGTPYRSYLYAADLAIWLWHILFRGVCRRPYNVGSDASRSILDIASLVAGVFRPPAEVVRRKMPDPGKAAERYIPSIDRASNELGLKSRVDLREAVVRTIRWHKEKEDGL
jgi:dTDP-glucose 4,6-dehydratase